MAPLAPRHIAVPRTARYYVVGELGPDVRDVWVVCHGYGQLAAGFAEPFRSLVRGDRVIVVPEALSRFYLEMQPPHTPESAVGALWMTREDREAEIADIVTYLDTLVEHMFEELSAHGVQRGAVQVHALGFSQGAPVVCRWAARGVTQVRHVVLWGSGVPQDVNLRGVTERWGALRVDMVYGEKDVYVTEEAVAAQRVVLDGSGVPYRVWTFSGGHVLNRGVLGKLMDGEG